MRGTNPQDVGVCCSVSFRFAAFVAIVFISNVFVVFVAILPVPRFLEVRRTMLTRSSNTMTGRSLSPLSYPARTRSALPGPPTRAAYACMDPRRRRRHRRRHCRRRNAVVGFSCASPAAATAAG